MLVLDRRLLLDNDLLNRQKLRRKPAGDTMPFNYDIFSTAKNTAGSKYNVKKKMYIFNNK